jgi:hypothetical protein
MPVTKENVDDVFSYHAPDEEQRAALITLREQAREMAHAILDFVPPSADQQAALRLLRECTMTANAGIMLKGAV